MAARILAQKCRIFVGDIELTSILNIFAFSMTARVGEIVKGKVEFMVSRYGVEQKKTGMIEFFMDHIEMVPDKDGVISINLNCADREED